MGKPTIFEGLPPESMTGAGMSSSQTHPVRVFIIQGCVIIFSDHCSYTVNLASWSHGTHHPFDGHTTVRFGLVAVPMLCVGGTGLGGVTHILMSPEGHQVLWALNLKRDYLAITLLATHLECGAEDWCQRKKPLLRTGQRVKECRSRGLSLRPRSIAASWESSLPHLIPSL